MRSWSTVVPHCGPCCEQVGKCSPAAHALLYMCEAGTRTGEHGVTSCCVVEWLVTPCGEVAITNQLRLAEQWAFDKESTILSIQDFAQSILSLGANGTLRLTGNIRKAKTNTSTVITLANEEAVLHWLTVQAGSISYSHVAAFQDEVARGVDGPFVSKGRGGAFYWKASDLCDRIRLQLRLSEWVEWERFTIYVCRDVCAQRLLVADFPTSYVAVKMRWRNAIEMMRHYALMNVEECTMVATSLRKSLIQRMRACVTNENTSILLDLLEKEC